MSEAADFFAERHAPAILKHGVLRKYLPAFIGKLGSTHGRIIYIDGYAGPGQYGDGVPGSPLYAAELIAYFEDRDFKVEAFFVEADSDLFTELEECLAPFPSATALAGNLSEHLDAILKEAGTDPLFLFLDPFGLGDITFDRLVTDVMSRGGVTEVLLNFVRSGFYRSAGHLTSEKDYPAKAAFVEKVDQLLGGDWWQAEWLKVGSDAGAAETEARDEAVVAEYVGRLCAAAGGWGCYWTSVEASLDGTAVYYLALLTKSRHGSYSFNEALSFAAEIHRQYLLSEAGQLDLRPLAAREAEWIAEIEANLSEFLSQGKSVTPFTELSAVFGGALGKARSKHLRAALRSLHEKGVTITDPKGKGFEKRTYLPKPNAQT